VSEIGPLRRGSIVQVSFDPAIGSEAAKSRPAVIVSNNGANAAAARVVGGLVTVVPITSNTARVHPFQVFIPAEASGLRLDSKAQAEQVRTISTARVQRFLGRLPAELLAELDEALRIHLAL